MFGFTILFNEFSMILAFLIDFVSYFLWPSKPHRSTYWGPSIQHCARVRANRPHKSLKRSRLNIESKTRWLGTWLAHGWQTDQERIYKTEEFPLIQNC